MRENRMPIALIALLRGINVGRAKRMAMADLRTLIQDLGYTDVRTVLNSGNVVLNAPDDSPDEIAARIQETLAARTGVSARVTALTAAAWTEIVDGNPLIEIADNPSRLLVAVLMDPGEREKLDPLLKQDWRPDVLALGTRVVYMWCPEGMSASKLPGAVERALGDAMTIRNWATVLRLYTLVQEQEQS